MSVGGPTARVGGEWRSRRHDHTNSGRADAVGGFTTAPVDVASIGTGGDLRSIRSLRADGEPLVVVLAGTCLQAFDGAGARRWALPSRSVTRLIAAGDLDGSGSGQALVRVGTSRLSLVEASDGAERWGVTLPSGTFVHDLAGVLLVPRAGGHRLVLCPVYGTTIEAYDIVGGDPPRLAWTIDGPWDAGFGPSVVAADMFGSGRLDLVLSSRVGDADRTRLGRTSGSEVVLGRRNGRLYQAVHDLDDGSHLTDVAFVPARGAWRCARPYGLLTTAPASAGQRPSIVMVGCQVEEYLAVTRRTVDGRLRRGWGHVVEKDWPIDERELRVHPDGVADIDGDGRGELVVSLWDDGRWRTFVLDLAVGWSAPKAVYDDRVIWGVLERPSSPDDDRARGQAPSRVLALSVERERRTGRPTTLELRDGSGGTLLGRLDDASIVIAPDAALPAGVAFMAERRAGSQLRMPGGEAAIVVRRWRDDRPTSVAAWMVSNDGAAAIHLARGDVTRIDEAFDGILVGRPDGSITRLGWHEREGRHPRARVRAAALVSEGREAASLVRRTPAGPELLVELAGGTMLGVRPWGRTRWRRNWRTPGRLAAMRSDGQDVIAATGDGTGVVARVGGAGLPEAWRAELDAPLDHAVLPLPDGGVLLTLRTGVHHLASEVRDRRGRLVRRIEAGAYLHPPALLERSRDWLVVLDDHGTLIAIDRSGAEHWRSDWTAAYTLPITGPFAPDARPGVLRAGGIHGPELLDARGRRVWRRDAALWSHAAGAAAVARRSDGSYLAVQPRRDGHVEAFLASTGRVVWELDIDGHESASVTAGDIDGDGTDELLVGLPDGRLLCVRDARDHALIAWELDLGAGVIDAYLADVDDSGRAAIVTATSDGRVRVLRAS